MAFRPERPTTADYQASIAGFILDAIPGAREKDDAVAASLSALTAASTKALDASRKFHELGGPDGPRATVKRAAWSSADDAYRAATAAHATASTAYNLAAKVRFNFVYDAMDEPAFAEKVGPMFADASRRAADALDALKLALTERDEFLSALGRVLDVDGGNWGLRNALSEVTAYVDADLVDEDAAAWAVVTDAIGAAILMAGDRARILTECVAVRDDTSIPASAKEAAYRAILDRRGLTQRRVIR